MNEFSTVFLTVLSGVAIYVLGQLIVRFFIEPYKNIRQTIEEAIYIAFVYDKIFVSTLDITDPKEYDRLVEAKRAFREKGSRLIASINLFPLYSYMELFFPNIPKKDDLLIGGQLLLAMGDFLGNVHDGDELMKLSQYRYLVVEKLGINVIDLEKIDWEKIRQILIHRYP